MSAQTPAQPTVTYFRLSGTVTDPEGAPVPDADVVLVQDSTPARLIRSDSEGRFVVTDLVSPLVTVRVRHLGFRARTIPVRISKTERHASIVIPLETAVTQLQGVSILGEEVEPDARLRGFEQRRRTNSFGSYVDRAAIERQRVQYISEVLRPIRGMTVQGSRRIGNTVRIRGCSPLVWVDGVRLPGAELDEVVQPSDVAAIEIYAAFAGIPAQFFDRTATCGTILVWTRSR